MNRAVVFGVDEYRDDDIQNLQGSKNDATELHKLFSETQEFQVEKLVGPSATGAAIREAVGDVLLTTDHADLVLLYFSGHAFKDEFDNVFLAPYDMDRSKPFKHGLRTQELTDLMRGAVNKDVVLLILDACYAGVAAKGEKGEAPSPPLAETMSRLDADEHGAGRIVLASSGPYEKSHEREDCSHQYLGGGPHTHGAFTYHVLEGLSGLAASKGADVTLHDLHSYVDGRLEGGQTVQFFGSGVQKYKDIRLLRATRFEEISATLVRVEELLKDDESDVFQAFSLLMKIRDQTHANDRAIELRSAIDNRLKADEAIIWDVLMDRKLDLNDDCPKSCAVIEKLVASISFDTLADANRKLVGLTMGLWQAARSGDEDDFNTWLTSMKNFEKQSKAPQPRQVAEPAITGLR